jgi:two-component system sensor histidine kinase CpxA
VSLEARELASGDLQTRVGPALGSRRDELAELGRDFDAMAARIEALVTAQQRLLGDISHELRSPLARLGVALDLARRRGGRDIGDLLGRIELESERLDELIGELLELNRLESGDEIAREPIDLAALVEEIAADADFEAQADDRSVRVVSTEACEVAGDRNLLRRAIENVARNAVRYTPEETTVEVALGCDERDAVVRVRDFGPGVSDEELPNLFRPFYRVAGARERDTGGAGLGLAITERAVAIHGGSVAASNASGGGLTVEIRLPRMHSRG